MHLISHLIDYMRWYNGESRHSGLWGRPPAEGNSAICILVPTTSADSSNLPTACAASSNVVPAHRMNYGLDMPPYQEIADWLDDDGRIHSCKFRSAYAGFEIMMALSRSAVNGGQVALPLTEAADEVEMMKQHLADRKVLLSSPVNAKEYGQ